MIPTKKLTAMFIVFFTIAMMTPTIVPISVQAASIKLNKTTAKVPQERTITLKVSGTKSKVVWTSSNKKVATVSSGKVKGIKKGTCTITAKTKGKTLKCKVTVGKPLALNKKTATLNYGKTINLSVLNNVNKEKISWTSNNKKIVSVNSSGVVTAKNIGIATITATTADKKKYTCKVKVVFEKLSVAPVETAPVKMKEFDDEGLNFQMPEEYTSIKYSGGYFICPLDYGTTLQQILVSSQELLPVLSEKTLEEIVNLSAAEIVTAVQAGPIAGQEIDLQNIKIATYEYKGQEYGILEMTEKVTVSGMKFELVEYVVIAKKENKIHQVTGICTKAEEQQMIQQIVQYMAQTMVYQN